MFTTALFIIAKVWKQRKCPSTWSSCITQKKHIKMQDPHGRGDLKIDNNLQKSQGLGRCDVLLLLWKPAAGLMWRLWPMEWAGRPWHILTTYVLPMALAPVQVTQPVGAKRSWPLQGPPPLLWQPESPHTLYPLHPRKQPPSSYNLHPRYAGKSKFSWKQ